ncbi:MAG TPA: hypothetical protein GXZ90_00405 [Clostridiales bacterium]|nr:hypothetical protein [Clostridiales bacterium]
MTKDILEGYLKQGFEWIYKYNETKIKDKSKTRIFYEEPWFSIEGGMTWVDLNSCKKVEVPDKTAIFIDLDIVDLDEPIKISEYISIYC